MEAEIIPKDGWKFRGIAVGKMRRYFSWENFLDFFRTGIGFWQSVFIILSFKPDVIFSKGGYVSLPVAVAGGFLKVPVVIHESDVEPGLGTKISAKFARVICLSYEESRKRWGNDSRVVITGNPVRDELKDGHADKGWKFSGLDKAGKPVILVMGGSQGAQFINGQIEENLDELLKNFQIVHICGKGKISVKSKEGYFSCEYINEELKDIYAISSIILSRAGANSLAEIAYLQKPAILIPLVAGSRGDQIKNAEVFAKTNPAEIIDERTYKGDIVEQIKQLWKRSEKWEWPKNSTNNAAEKIADIIIDFKKNAAKRQN